MKRFLSKLLGATALLVLAIAFTGSMAGHASAAAGVRANVTYQARLMDASGYPVADGVYQVRFSLYDAAVAGTRLWTASGTTAVPTPVNVSVQDGLFTALLGDGVTQLPFGDLDWNSDSLYLGVTIGGDAEMGPRRPITAVPQAINSSQLNGMSASGTDTYGGESQFTINQASTTAATSTRSALDVRTNGTSLANDFILRGLNGVGSAVFTVNSQGSVTSSNLFVSGVVSTTQLFVNGQQVCLQDGTNCLYPAEADTFASVTARGATTSQALTLFAGATMNVLSVTDTAVIANLNATNIVATDTTTTNLFSTVVSTTQLFVNGMTVCLNDGTNCPASFEIDTLASVTARGATTSVAVTFFGGVTTSQLNVTSELLSPSGTIAALFWSDATGTNTTGTNAYFANLRGSSASFTDLLSTSSTFGQATATAFFSSILAATNAGIVNATTTNLAFTNASGASMVVTVLNGSTVNASTSNIASLTFANATGGILDIVSVSATSLLVSGQNVCLANGTNCLTVYSTDTLATITARGATTSVPVSFFGGVTSSNINVSGTANLANVNASSVSSTNGIIAALVSGAVSSTDLFSSNIWGTSASFTNLTVSGTLVCLANGTNCQATSEIDNLLSVTNRGSVATATLSLLGGFTTNNATVTSTLTVSGTVSSNLVPATDLTFALGTPSLRWNGNFGTVTTTNLFATNLVGASATFTSATATNFFASLVSSSQVLVNGFDVCLSNGTNCAPSAGEADTLATVTARGATTSVAVTFFGGVTTTNLNATSALIDGLSWTNATGTNTTGTNAFFANLRGTTGSFSELYSASSTLGQATATAFYAQTFTATDAGITNVTTTNLAFTNASGASMIVTVLNSSTVNASTSNIGTATIGTANVTTGTITALVFTNATGATLDIGSVSATSLLVSGQNVCLADGTNCLSMYSTDTLATVTARGATTSIAVSFFGGATASNLNVSGTSNLALINASSVNVTGGISAATGSIAGLITTNSTTTNSTSTNLFVTNGVVTNGVISNVTSTNAFITSLVTSAVSSTDFFSSSVWGTSASFTNLMVSGTLVCLADGTNCSYPAETDTLLSVTNRGSVATATLSLLGGFTTNNATVTSTLTVSGTVSSDLIPTTDLTYSLGTPALRWNGNFGDVTIVNSTTSNATSTNLFASDATIGGLIATTANIADLIATNATLTNVTSTNGVFTNLLGSNLAAGTATVGTSTIGFVNVTGSIFAPAGTVTTLNGSSLVFGNATITNATATNLFATLVSSSQVLVNGIDVCLADGTNCVPSAGEADTLASVTARGATTSVAVTFFGGATTSNLNVSGTSNLANINASSVAISGGLSAVTGSIVGLSWTNATGTNTTGTNAFFANLRGTTGSFSELYSVSSTLGQATATAFFAQTFSATDAGITNVTTTNLAFTNASGASMIVTVLNSSTVNASTSNISTATIGTANVTTGTITSLVFTNATGATLDIGSVSATSLLVSGQNVCLANGTNCLSMYSTDTLATVTARGATTSVAVSFFGGVTSSNLNVSGTSNLANINASTVAVSGGISAATGSITGLIATNATATNVTSTNGSITNLTGTNSNFTNGTTTNATSTNLFATNGVVTNGVISNVTSTNAFITSLVTSAASSTDFFSSSVWGTSASFTNLLVANQQVCLADGTNCSYPAETDTLLSVTNRGSVATTTLSLLGGFTTNNATVTSTLTVSGTVSSDLIPTTDLTYTLGTPSLRWNGNFGDVTIVNGTTTNATSTNLFATNAALGSLIANSGNIAELLATNATLTNVTSTNGVFTNLLGSNLVATTGTITNLSGSGLVYTNATFTNATATNLFASLVSSSQVLVNGLDVCLVDGTNCAPSAGEADTLATVTARGATTSVAVTFFGGATTTNLNATSALIDGLVTSNATATNVTSTNLVATKGSITGLSWTNATGTNTTGTNAFFANLNGTTASFNELYSVSSTLGQATATAFFAQTFTATDAGITNVTTTNLAFTNASGASMIVTVLNSSTVNASTSNIGTATIGTANVTTGTITSLVFTNATGATLDIGSVSATSLLVSGQSVCLADGTNCLSMYSTDTLATVTARGATTSVAVTFFGGATASNLNVSGTSNLALINASSVNVTGGISAATGSITGLITTNATATNVTSTNGSITNLTGTNSNFVNGTTTNSTSTNLFATNGVITNSTSTNLFATNGVISNVTSTNGFITSLVTGAVSSTNLFSSSVWGTSASFTNLLVAGQNVCLADGTNCTYPDEADTLLSVTNRGSVATATLSLLGGFTTNNATVTSTLTVSGTVSSNLVPTTDLTYSLGTPSLRWNGNLGDVTIVNGTTTNATSTNLFATNATIGGLIATTANITDLIAINATLTNVTSTNGVFTNLLGSNLVVGTANVGTSTIGFVNVTGSLFAPTGTITGLNGSNLVFGNATFTNATATNLFASLVSSSQVLVGGYNVCLSNGTNCPAAAAEADTLASVTARGATTSVAVTFFGGVTTTNLNATSALIDGLVSTNATATNVTTTNLVATKGSISGLSWTNATGTNTTGTNAFFANLNGTTASFSELYSASSTLGQATATAFFAQTFTATDAGITNVTTTNLAFTNASGASMIVTVLNSSTVNASTSNIGTATIGTANVTTGTITSLVFTNATGATLDIGSVSATSLLVSGQNVCLANGTNCLSMYSTDTLAMVTARGATTSVAVTFFGGVTSSNINVSGTANLANVNASTVNVTGGISAATGSITGLITTNGTTTNSTSTNLFATNGVITNVTSTNGFITSLVTGAVSSTNLFSSSVWGTSASFTNLLVANQQVCLADGTNCSYPAEADTLLSVTNRGSVATATLTLLGGALTNNLNVSNTATIANAIVTSTLVVSGTVSSNLAPTTDLTYSLGSASLRWNGNFGDVTTTNLLTTNLIGTSATFTNATATNVFASLVSSSQILVGGYDVCLSNGTNCPAAAAEADTLASVTARGATTSVAVTFFGGVTTTNLNATSALIDGLVTTNATATNVTSTNLFAVNGTITSLAWTNATGTNTTGTNAFFASLRGTTGSFSELYSVSSTLGQATATAFFTQTFTATNAGITNATTTNLAFTNASGASMIVTVLNSSTVNASTSNIGTANVTTGTITSLTFTNATGSVLDVLSVSATSLLVSGQQVCLANGDNCLSATTTLQMAYDNGNDIVLNDGRIDLLLVAGAADDFIYTDFGLNVTPAIGAGFDGLANSGFDFSLVSGDTTGTLFTFTDNRADPSATTKTSYILHDTYDNSLTLGNVTSTLKLEQDRFTLNNMLTSITGNHNGVMWLTADSGVANETPFWFTNWGSLSSLMELSNSNGTAYIHVGDDIDPNGTYSPNASGDLLFRGASTGGPGTQLYVNVNNTNTGWRGLATTDMVCLSDGSNCPSMYSTDTLAIVTARGATTSVPVTFLGGVTTTNVNASSALIDSLVVGNATMTSVTATTLYTPILVATDAGITNATATTLVFTNASGSTLFSTDITGVNASFTSLLVSGQNVCLANGINCLSQVTDWTFDSVNGLIRPTTTTNDVLMGSAATSTGAPFYLETNQGAGTSTLFVGYNTSSNLIIGGTSNTVSFMNADFANAFNGNDLFVGGNIGSASSVYTNGEFVVGNASMHIGNGYIRKTDGDITFDASSGFILPMSDMGLSLGSDALRFNGLFGNTTSSNATTTNLFASGIVSTTNLFVNGKQVCLADGTNCLPSSVSLQDAYDAGKQIALTDGGLEIIGATGTPDEVIGDITQLNLYGVSTTRLLSLANASKTTAGLEILSLYADDGFGTVGTLFAFTDNRANPWASTGTAYISHITNEFGNNELTMGNATSDIQFFTDSLYLNSGNQYIGLGYGTFDVAVNSDEGFGGAPVIFNDSGSLSPALIRMSNSYGQNHIVIADNQDPNGAFFGDTSDLLFRSGTTGGSGTQLYVNIDGTNTGWRGLATVDMLGAAFEEQPIVKVGDFDALPKTMSKANDIDGRTGIFNGVIFDLTNPYSPVALYTVSSTDSVIKGSRLYTIDDDEFTTDFLKIYDITNPSSPQTIGNFDLGSTSTVSDGRITVDGTTVYFATVTSVKIFDAKDPSAIVELGSVAVSGTQRNVSIAYNNGYLIYTGEVDYGPLTATSTLEVFDVRDPSAPVSVSHLEYPSGHYLSGDGRQDSLVHVSDRRAYVFSRDSNPLIRVYDLADPANPVERASIDPNDITIYDFAVSDSALFVQTGGDDGSDPSFQDWDITDRDAPVLRSELNGTDNSLDFFVTEGAYAFGINGNEDLRILGLGGLKSRAATFASANLGQLTVGTRLTVRGNAEFNNGITVDGRSVCLSDGTNCPASSIVSNWSFNPATGSISPATSTNDIIIGSVATSTGAPFYFETNQNAGTSTLFVGYNTSSNLIIGGTSSSFGFMNADFAGGFNGNDLFVGGNIGSASSVYTNGEFVVGNASMHIGNGYIRKTDGDIILDASSGFILPGVDGVSLGSAAYRFNAYLNNATATNVTTTNFFASGMVSTTELYVTGQRACLENGTNCPTGLGLNASTTEYAARRFNSVTNLPFGHTTIDVQGRGNYAFALQSVNIDSQFDGIELVAYDITTSTPERVSAVVSSELSAYDRPTNLIIDDGYAYIAASSTLLVYSISDTADILEFSRTEIFPGGGDAFRAIVKYGNVMYGVTALGLVTIDVTNPAEPVMIDSSAEALEINNTIPLVKVDNGTLYIFSNSNSFTPYVYKYGLSNPRNPSFIDYEELANNGINGITGADIVDGYYYIRDGNSVIALQAHDPYNVSTVIGAATSPDTCTSADIGLVVANKRAYFACTENGLSVFDLTDPTNVIYRGTKDLGFDVLNDSGAKVTSIDGSRLYIGSVGHAFVVDMGGIYTDALVAGGAQFGYADVLSDMRVGGRMRVGDSLVVGRGGIASDGDITVNGSKVCLENGTNCGSRMSAYASEQPLSQDNFVDVFAKGDFAYFAMSAVDQVEIYNLVDPTNPQTNFNQATPRMMYSSLVGNRWYAVDDAGILYVYRLDGFMEPNVIGSIDLVNDLGLDVTASVRFIVQGDYLMLVSDGVLISLNVSDPGNITLVSDESAPPVLGVNSMRLAAEDGNFFLMYKASANPDPDAIQVAYGLWNDNGDGVINMDNQFEIPGMVSTEDTNVALVDKRLFVQTVSAGESVINVYDVSGDFTTLMNPPSIDTINPPGDAISHFEAVGNRLYIASHDAFDVDLNYFSSYLSEPEEPYVLEQTVNNAFSKDVEDYNTQRTFAITGKYAIGPHYDSADNRFEIMVISLGGFSLRNLYAANAGFGDVALDGDLSVDGAANFSNDITVRGLGVCLSDGTNCPASAGGTNVFSADFTDPSTVTSPAFGDDYATAITVNSIQNPNEGMRMFVTDNGGTDMVFSNDLTNVMTDPANDGETDSARISYSNGYIFVGRQDTDSEISSGLYAGQFDVTLSYGDSRLGIDGGEIIAQTSNAETSVITLRSGFGESNIAVVEGNPNGIATADAGTLLLSPGSLLPASQAYLKTTNAGNLGWQGIVTADMIGYAPSERVSGSFSFTESFPTGYDVQVTGTTGIVSFEYVDGGVQYAWKTFDLSDPANPVLLYEDPGNSSVIVSLQIDGSVLYIVRKTGATTNVESWDITDPSVPTLLNTLDLVLPGYQYNWAATRISGTKLYTVTDGTLSIVDITNPAALALDSQLPSFTTHFGNRNDLVVDGNYVYYAGNPAYPDDQLDVIDVSNPLAPSVVATIPVPGYGVSPYLKLVGTSLYWLQDNTLTIIDISNPLAPVIDSSVTPGGLAGFLSGYTIDGSNVYVSDDSQIATYDISDLSTPTDSISVTNGVRSQFIIGNFIVGITNAALVAYELTATPPTRHFGSNAAWDGTFVNVSATSIMVNNVSVCLQDGTNCPVSGGSLQGAYDGGNQILLVDGGVNLVAVTSTLEGSIQQSHVLRGTFASGTNEGFDISMFANNPNPYLTGTGTTFGYRYDRSLPAGFTTSSGLGFAISDSDSHAMLYNLIPGGLTQTILMSSQGININPGTNATTTFAQRVSLESGARIVSNVLPDLDGVRTLGSVGNTWDGFFDDLEVSNLTVGGVAVCLQDGTNCPVSGGSLQGAYDGGRTINATNGTIQVNGYAAGTNLYPGGSLDWYSSMQFGLSNATNQGMAITHISTSTGNFPTSTYLLFSTNLDDPLMNGTSTFLGADLNAGSIQMGTFGNSGITVDQVNTQIGGSNIALTGSVSVANFSSNLYALGDGVLSVGAPGNRWDAYLDNVSATSVSTTFLEVNGQGVCLADGTNCPSGLGGWAYDGVLDLVRVATSTSDILIGAADTSTAGAPAFFDTNNGGSSTFFFGYNTSSNVVIGGTSTTVDFMNSAFVMNGDDLFVGGNIGSVSSVYTNGEFIVGPGSTHYGDGYLNKNNGNFTLQASGGFILPSSDLGLSLGSASARFNATLGNVTATNLTVTGTLAFAGALDQAFNVNSSSSMVYTDVTTVFTGATSVRLAVDGNRFYIAHSSSVASGTGVRSYDTRQFGTYSGTSFTNASDIVAANNLLYALVGADNSFRISRVDGIGNGASLGSLSNAGFDFSTSSRMALSGNFVYIADRTNLKVVDMTNRAAPRLVNTVAGLWSAGVISMDIENNNLIVTYRSGTAVNTQFYTLADPVAPVAGSGFGNVDATHNPMAVMQGSNVYVLEPINSTLRARNMSGTDVANWTIADTSAISLEVQGDYAYVLGNDLTIVNLKTGQMKVVAGAGSYPYALKVSGRHVFTAGQAGYKVYDIGGVSAAGANFGSVQIGSLRVASSLDVNDVLNVGSGLIVNNGGALIEDSLRVNGTSASSAILFVTNNEVNTGDRAWGAYIDQLLVGNSSTATGTLRYAALFGYGATGTGLCLDDISSAQTCPGGQGNSIEADGAVTANAFDIAEMYAVNGPSEAGDVLVFDPTATATVQISSGNRYDRRIAGVVSTKPGFVLGWSEGAAVALAGRVPTKVSVTNGDIKVGDALTTSEYPGYAMKATKPGMILGYALEDVSATGTIEVFIDTGYNAFATLGTDGSIATLTDDLVVKGLESASASTSTVDSFGLTFHGEGWDTTSSMALAYDFTMRTDMLSTTNARFVIENSFGSSTFSVDQDGIVRANAFEVNDSFDLAERYESADTLEPGDLIMISPDADRQILRTNDDQASAIGVISTKAGFTLGANASGTYPVALAGRVPTKVTALNGEIKRGDALVASTIPGVAQKATVAGQIIGYALENYAGTDNGLIESFIQPGLWIPKDKLEAISSASTSTGSGTGVARQGFAKIVTGGSRVHVAYASINAFPVPQVTAMGNVSGGWWLENVTDAGFDIVLDTIQPIDIQFAWQVSPSQMGIMQYSSDGTYGQLDPLTGQLVSEPEAEAPLESEAEEPPIE